MTKARAKKRPKSSRGSASKGKAKGKSATGKRIAVRPAAKRAKSEASKRPSGLPLQDKPAIRSEAFARAILDAKSYAADPDSLRALFDEASAKAATIPESALKELGPHLPTMLRLIRAYSDGGYTEIARDHLLTIVAAVSYLVDPFDLIPDEVPFLGYVDDATVIEFAALRSQPALHRFMAWEARGG
jgi:uncharacterized membrane protein YkvA (DUF1232 family)